MKHAEINMPDWGEIIDNLMNKKQIFFFLSLTLQICFSSTGWRNKYAIGLICTLNDFIQLSRFAIVSRLMDQEPYREYTVEWMWLEKRKGKRVERKFTSAVLTFLFYPSPNRIWLISCFISKRWFREYLPILIQANAECEKAARNKNDPPDKKVCSGISWSVPYSLSCLCRLQHSKMQKNDGQRKRRVDFSSAVLQHVWTPTFSLRLQSQWLYEESEPTCLCPAKCIMRASGWISNVSVCVKVCILVFAIYWVSKYSFY